MWAVANITVFKNAVIVRSPFLEFEMRAVYAARAFLHLRQIAYGLRNNALERIGLNPRNARHESIPESVWKGKQHVN
jgi:hypothetical protein